jgi:hypothetical protein
MFGSLFKTKQQKVQDTNAVIQEIHDTFYSEVDRLLAEAKCMRPVETDKQELIEKKNRLQALGFTATPEVQEAKKEQERLQEIRRENKAKQEMSDVVQYFSFKYPFYKFITEESVVKICQKYNLIYADVSRYTGTVPDKNLTQIEKFRIQEDDECYIEKSRFSRNNSYMSRETYLSNINFAREQSRHGYSSSSNYHKAPLEICAPLKDFNTEGMELKNFKLSKIEIPDPIVLKPVFYKNKKHYLIVTAWGLEASDEAVLNPVHN